MFTLLLKELFFIFIQHFWRKWKIVTATSSFSGIDTKPRVELSMTLMHGHNLWQMKYIQIYSYSLLTRQHIHKHRSLLQRIGIGLFRTIAGEIIIPTVIIMFFRAWFDLISDNTWCTYHRYDCSFDIATTFMIIFICLFSKSRTSIIQDFVFW